jgi:putative transposase
MRPKGPAERLENRRRALELLKQGHSLHEVAGFLNCAPSSVMRWRDAWKRDGLKSLHVRSSPGRPQKLHPSQLRKLHRLLLKGARANGFSTDVWTTSRIAQVIAGRFAVQYHRDHIGRLMRSLGWTHHRLRLDFEHIDEESEPRDPPPHLPVTRNLQGWVPITPSARGRDLF